MKQITFQIDDQKHASLVLAARIREIPFIGNEPDWEAFYNSWHLDAEAIVQREAAKLIGLDPDLSAQMLVRLQTALTPAPTPIPAPTPETTTIEETQP
jgi:hypothetical protein